ncbi:MAG: hypothetical protein AABX00_01245 [Nanoarchaeota archaeon]
MPEKESMAGLMDADRAHSTKENLWFRAKTYGWGWYPCSREGWAIIGIYAILVILSTKILPNTQLFFLTIILLVSSLLVIFYRKGEKPGWRWGNKMSKISK